MSERSERTMNTAERSERPGGRYMRFAAKREHA
jgi:hypothetical protein